MVVDAFTFMLCKQAVFQTGRAQLVIDERRLLPPEVQDSVALYRVVSTGVYVS